MSDSDHRSTPLPPGRDFIRTRIASDLAEGRYAGVVTRFPPEPNGYLHIGHAKSICLNFGIAEEFGGRCHLRFDDTNPLTEDEVFVQSIQDDVRWLGFDWGDRLHHASDYFERMWEVAEGLIRDGLAYVDDAPEEEIREARGTVTEPGRPTPARDRAPEENLDLFRRMRAGEFPDGSHVLRARIDLASPNMLMRDPILYRIRHASHHRTGDAWCVYPLYDFAHCLEDAFEDVTHSLCTLEFENNRELYDWILDHAGFTEPRPHQREFARLRIGYAVLSKRKLIRLVREGHVEGWDDPRMPTLAGLRRRGVPPEAVRAFIEGVGVTRADTLISPERLDAAIRDVLNPIAPRLFAVARPLRVVLANWPEGEEREFTAPLFPDLGVEAGARTIHFGRELLIDREDFALDPPPGWKRLAPGWSVRLRHAGVIRCDEVRVDPETGEPVELLCTLDEGTLDGARPKERARGTIHWVSARRAVPIELRLHGRLFTVEEPDALPEGEDFIDTLDPASLERVTGAMGEAAFANLAALPIGPREGFPVDAPAPSSRTPLPRFQFERVGYFALDREAEGSGLVFNRIVTLREGWSPEKERRKAATDGGKAGDSLGTPVPPRKPSAGSLSSPQAASSAPPPPPPLAEDPESAAFHAAALTIHPDPEDLERWMRNELRGLSGGRPLTDLPFRGEALGRLASLVAGGRITRPVGRQVLARMVEEGGDPEEIVRKSALEAVTDDAALGRLAEAAVAAHPAKVAEYRAGKRALLGFFIGEVMRSSGGRADPAGIRSHLVALLES